MKESPPIAIITEPFDPETNDQPFGKRWGGQVIQFDLRHLSALHAGKTLALDVQGEYIVFVQLNQPATPPND